MTRDRNWGNDIDFLAWVRRQRDLPSYSKTCGLGVTDCDFWIHRYMTCVDAIGTKEVQALMMLEIKTRGGDLPKSQQDTLAKVNLFRGKSGNIRHFGVSVVRLSDTTPDNSTIIQWGRFTETMKIAYRPIDIGILLGLLRFDLHPDNLEPKPFRRHHKTKEIMAVETAELGFEYEKPYKIVS